MSGQIEVRMIGEIYWCRFRHGGGKCSRECIIWQKFENCICNNSSWITLEFVGIHKRHNDFRTRSECVPIELIEADSAAMQLMFTTQILVHFERFTIQCEFTISDSIAYAANRRTKIWIRCRTITCNKFSFSFQYRIMRNVTNIWNTYHPIHRIPIQHRQCYRIYLDTEST